MVLMKKVVYEYNGGDKHNTVYSMTVHCAHMVHSELFALYMNECGLLTPLAYARRWDAKF